MSILDSINRFKDIGKASLPKPNQPIEAVLEFVEQNLPEFINEIISINSTVFAMT